VVPDEPRAVIIRGRLEDSHGGLRSPTPPPAALHVCLESHEVALKNTSWYFLLVTFSIILLASGSTSARTWSISGIGARMAGAIFHNSDR
jgi:hypothetical protein